MKPYPGRIFDILLNKSKEARDQSLENKKNIGVLAGKMTHLINIMADCPHCSKKLKGVRDKFKGKPLG